jgi:Domain of unknown function (DUF4411)
MIGFFTPKYIFDTGPIIELKSYYSDVFISLWENLENLLKAGEIQSCTEVYRELQRRDDEARAIADRYKHIFKKPEIEELKYVTEILRNHKELIKTKNILGGYPVADPFIIAQAICNRSILVTSESYKPNSHNIPNICKEYKVECLKLKDFFLKEGWNF